MKMVKLPAANSNSPNHSDHEGDEELNELLDDAMKDFDGLRLQPSSLSGASRDEASAWEAEFNRVQGQIPRTPRSQNSGPTLPEDEIVASLHDALQNITENTDYLDAPISEEDIRTLLTKDESPSQILPGIMPMMQNVMKGLLSKDVLYPTMKEVVDKFPGWLTENRAKVSKNDSDRYDKQYELMSKICSEFESEQSSDSDEDKDDRGERILTLLMEAQTYGQPPQDLMGGVSTPLPPGLPDLDSIDPDNCAFM